MPTYEYHCKACGKTSEIFHSMADAPKRKCPACGKNALERKIGTGAAILFKGSGFYQTDYRSESYKKAAESESKPAEAKADSAAAKPAANPDPPKKEPVKAADPKPAKKPRAAGPR